MGNSRTNDKTTMGGNRSNQSIFNYGKLFSSWFGCNQHRSEDYKYRKSNYKLKYFFAIILLALSPKTLANTVSSPSASSSGTVINNGYQSISGGFPTHRFSNGIQCQLPTLGINPFITKGENFSLPRSTTTRTNIYDLSEDANGNLINPGRILYTSEQPRLDQTTYNLNYGVTMSIQIPLGKKFNDMCLRAAEANIKGQEFALTKLKLEANLARLKICAEQLKLGVKFVGDDAVTCKNVVLTSVPNQVLPHTHEIKTKK